MTMNSVKWAAVCCGVCCNLTLFSSYIDAQAQAGKSPKQFFSSGYVNASRDSSQASSSLASRAVSSTESEEAEAESSSESKESIGLRPPKKSGEEFAQERGLKVSSITLLLAAHDTAHFQVELAKVLKLTKQTGLKLSELYLVGDTKALYREKILAQFGKQLGGVIMRTVNRIPAELGAIQKSPVLLLTTSKGVLAVEGYPSLYPLFNAQGEFLPPAGALRIAAPTPTVTIAQPTPVGQNQQRSQF